MAQQAVSGEARRDRERLTALVDALTRAAASRRCADGEGSGPCEAATAVAAAVDRPGQAAARALGGVTAGFAADGSALPPGSALMTPVREDTLFDMASVTKVVTTLTAATLVDDGVLDPHAPVAEHLRSPHPAITAHHLLTHTSGLPPVMPLWRVPGGRRTRLDAVSRATLVTAPGEAYAYSCIGFILLGALLEQLTGTSLPELAHDRVLVPAGAVRAGWEVEPGSAALAAATEYQEDPPRGLVRGATHDETAWSLGGAGNAGVFATLEDALALGRVIADRAPGPRLSASVRSLLGTDQLPPGLGTGTAWRQGLGLRIGQELEGGTVLGHVLGHPGFTGTSVLADPRTGTVAVLLSNRVHPHRTRFTVERSRRELAGIAFG